MRLSPCVLTLSLCPGVIAAPVSIGFESLDQSEIFSGDTWAGTDTADLLATFAGQGLAFSAGISGVNVDNVGLPSGDGTNAIMNATETADVQSVTPTFSMIAVGGTWAEFSFDALVLNPGNDPDMKMTAFDGSDNELGSVALSDTALGWETFLLPYVGIARIEFTGKGADIFLDAINYEHQGVILIPLPTAAGLASVATGALMLGRRRPQ